MTTETPYIERSEEERRLDSILEKSSEYESRLVWLFGDTGQGKTRFLREYMKRKRDLCTVGYAGCSAPVGNQSSSILNPYQALKDVIENLLQGQRDSQRNVNLLKNISLTVLACIPIVGDVAYGIKEIRRDWSEYKRGERTVDFDRFVEDYFETLLNLARDTPVVLALDDVQWIDSQSVGALERFLTGDKFQSARVVIILSGRGSELHLSPGLAAFHTRFAQSPRVTECIMPPFDEEQVRLLVQGRFPSQKPDAGLVAWLHRKTGGNPFFLESYVQHLVTEGVVTREGRAQGDLDSWQGLPAEIKAVTSWLMGTLPEEQLNILFAASVLGFEFSLHELAHLTNSPILELIRMLRRIKTVHGLCEPVGYRLVNGMESTVFRFSQHAIHTALYNELTDEEREAMHRSMAKYLHRLRLGSSNDPSVLSSIASALMLHSRLGKQPELELESIMLKARNTTDPLDHEMLTQRLQLLSEELGRPFGDINDIFHRTLAQAPISTMRPTGQMTVASGTEDRSPTATPWETAPDILRLLREGRPREALRRIEESMGDQQAGSRNAHPLFPILKAVAMHENGSSAAAVINELDPVIRDASMPAYQSLARILIALFSPNPDKTAALAQLRDALSYAGRHSVQFHPLILETIRLHFADQPEFLSLLQKAASKMRGAS